MTGPVRILLPPTASHLADLVLEAGCTPVLDATTSSPVNVPAGAWVRIRPGRPAPGSGPVILAEDGAPVLDRPTWLETAALRDVPQGFAGLVLKGSEAAGLGADQDGLGLLASAPDPSRILLDAGVGPRGAAAAAALGAAGVIVQGAILATPELSLAANLLRHLSRPDDELTQRVAGFRVGNSPTAPVLRQLLAGEDPWSLAAQVWSTGDLRESLWLLDQGAALATGLAERHGTLRGVLDAYAAAWTSWGLNAREATVAAPGRAVHSAGALSAPGTVAAPGGAVGTGPLWEEASWIGRPISGAAEPAVATGLAVSLPAPQVEAARTALLDRARAAGLPTERMPAPEPVVAPLAPAPSAPTGPAPESSVSAAAPQGAPAVAIVGMGCIMPDANDLATFWSNIKNGVSSIGDVPTDRWDPALYFNEDHDQPDLTYTKIGGFIRDFVFDSKRFRIPPRVAPQIDIIQQLTLHAVWDALVDANLQVDARDKEHRAFDRERTAVILGNSLGGELKDAYALRLGWPEVRAKIEASEAVATLPAEARTAMLDALEADYKRGLPIVDEDSMPGELSNVIAGRIANAFDLRGPNFTTDAACASSMAAIQAAVKGLQQRDFDVAVTGGADRSMNVPTYVKFCKIGALSPDHSSPFDESANGFVMGEGAGILILKRLEDAVADGDRVYAVIRGVGASSDGKGKGITAPNPIGQRLALERAYEIAGVDPATVDLIEAHGTSTVVGDGVELKTFSEFVGSGKRQGRGPIRVGSVKSMIGHLKSAAGAAATIKAAYALYEGVLPPSLGFNKAREDVPMDMVPVQVQTTAEPWPANPEGVRRAGVSAFGFGGTNFHMVLESWNGQALPASAAFAPTHMLAQPARAVPPVAAAPSAQAVAAPPVAARAQLPASIPAKLAEDRHRPLPEGLWATSALDRDALLHNLKALRSGQPAPWNPSDPLRIAAAADGDDERNKQLDRAIKVVEKGQNPELLHARNIYFEDGPVDGKVAFLFTGQGSQYLDMGLDLAEAYPMVAQTFAEADRIVAPTLGKGITDFIALRDGEDAEQKELILRQTEYSQPATLTLDVAILRLLAAHGVLPDMVAGHSLGEYGACVAAGIMDFEQALLAVSARGREMASIQLEDPGKMAGIAASADVVEEVLAEVGGYVIAANKNCPSQTVIAGASDAVDEAVERFQARGITVYRLPVSHAFHSSIVAPASEPLKGVLKRLGMHPPRRPITTNVTSEYYPTGEGAVEQVIETLGSQISAPVEWTSQVERMYGDGARLFVECGPKRALTGFVVSILKRRPHRGYYTNHPKRGGVWSFRDALAGLLAAGVPVSAEPASTVPDLFATPEPRKATTEAVTAHLALVEQATEARPDVKDGILRIVAAKTGYDVKELDPEFELEADLGIDTVKQAEIFAVVRETYGIPREEGFRFDQHRSLRSVIAWAADRLGATRPALPPLSTSPVATLPAAPAAAPMVDPSVVQDFLGSAMQAGVSGADGKAFVDAVLPSIQGLLAAAFSAAQQANPSPAAPAPASAPPAPAVPAAAPVQVIAGPMAFPRVVCSGASVGLPGGSAVFDDENLARILHGENRITHIGDQTQQFLDLGLVRLIKDPTTGTGSFLPVTDEDQVLRLAGQAKHFDLSEYGVPDNLIRAYDVTTQLVLAAAVEALRDAGIPLQRTYKLSASGKQVPQGWELPEALRDDTGVIFGSAFPGFDSLARHLMNNGDDGEGHFDRRFLFQILPMGHSQLAQAIGARGPNTQVNAACASATQAIGIAQDWIRLGRCKRVIVVSADNVTGTDLFRWIGGGFMAAGAASTHDVVEETALPFDARRHGLVLGMGAHGMVIETDAECRERGVTPIAELLDATFANSAFHGTRLHPTHIADVVRGAVGRAAENAGIDAQEIAESALFMSHETYTPARGGSAQAEIAALRETFGSNADQIVITNTKGYTGHPMGAGIEDTVAVKALQYGIMPPVANFKEPDPALGNLRIGRGEHLRVKYALRLAAGFGSQLAFAVWRSVAHDDDRVDDAVRLAWLKRVTGFDHVEEFIEQRTLRVRADASDTVLPLRPAVSPADVRDGKVALDGLDVNIRDAIAAPPPAAAPPAPSPSAPTPGPTASPADPAAMLAELMALIAEKTGYDPSELEPDFELEADLGIDTVKQAEIFSEIRDRHGLERDDEFSFAEYNTVEKLAAYLAEAVARQGTAAAPAAATASPAPSAPVPATTAFPAPEPAATASSAPEPPAVKAPAAAAGPVDVPGMIAELTALVAEKTGYAPDEIEPDFELEADLGIDTVKQAEIFSELRERHGLARDDDFTLADHPTVEALATWLAHAVAQGGGAPDPGPDDGGGAAPAPTPNPQEPVPQAPAVAAATPAPAKGFDPPPPPPVHRRPSDTIYPIDNDLSEGQTLAPDDIARGGPGFDAMLAELVQLVADKTGYAPDELEPDFELEADLGIDTVKQAEIFSELRDRHGLARDDDFSFAEYDTIEKLARYLSDRLDAGFGGQVDLPEDHPAAPPAPARAILPAPEPEGTEPPGPTPDVAPPGLRAPVRTVPLPDSFRLRRPVLVPAPAALTETLEGEVVHILGSGPVADALREALPAAGALLDGEPTVVLDVGTDVLEAFALARTLEAQRPARWFALTRLGGLDAIVADAPTALREGARAGFTKALGREWHDTRTRVVDVAPSISATEAASALIDELRMPSGGMEIFREGRFRRAIGYHNDPVPAAGALAARSVVLVTGGARGISARIAQELAERSPVTLVLVGRGPMATEALDLEAEKANIRNALKATGARVTPAEVERRLSPLRKADEVRASVAAMQAAGAQVHYERTDLTDVQAITDLVGGIVSRHGRLDVVIHGAGVEESRLIQDKDDAAFHRVFDGKALGGEALASAMPADTFFVSMGSVAGRFGNAGQVDYSAANDGLARLCARRANSLHLDWTAWDDVGMAVRGGMKRLLTDRGVDLLPADAGAGLLVDLVAGRVTGELVVAGGLGDFMPPPEHPLLDRCDQDGDRTTATRSVSVEGDAWIVDHSIAGTPVLPGVIGLELMAAVSVIAAPGQAYAGARDVQFSQPAKLHRGEPLAVQVHATDRGDGALACGLTSERALRTGRTQVTEHFSATVLLGMVPELEGLPAAMMPDETWSQADIYARFFHGPRFQVLTEIQGVAADALLAEGVVDGTVIADRLITEPLVLEAAFQAAGLHHMLTHDEMALPSSIDEVQLLGPCEPGTRLSLLVRRRGDVYDVDVTTDEGPLLRLRGFRMAVLGPLDAGQRFPRPEWERPQVFEHTAPSDAAEGHVARASADEDPTPWLTHDEIATLSSRGLERRVRDRVAGRIAAKRALSALTGVAPLDIRVPTAASGEPMAQVPGHPSARVSITHREGRAIAVATMSGRIGVDLEAVEPRPASFTQDWFTADEMRLVADDAARLTIAWSAKEAVQKVLGEGMAVSPRDIQVAALEDTGRVTVHLVGRAKERHEALGGAPLSLVWRSEGDNAVLVEARMVA